MRRVFLPVLAALVLLAASQLAAPKPAAASHVALCVVSSLVVPVPIALVSAFVAAFPPGTVLCVNSNCFHPGALPYSPFRASC
jgi:hypothetical protein